MPSRPNRQAWLNTAGASCSKYSLYVIAQLPRASNFANRGFRCASGTLLKSSACNSIKSNATRVSELDRSNIIQVLNRLSPVKPVEFLVRLGDTESAGGVSIHFEGNGWKLSGIQLPAAAAQILAQSLIDNKGRKG
jgi:hypothetical protein